jgi:hypothetical protein
MMTNDPHRRIRDAIAAHFAGAGAPARDGEMRAHLPTCRDCHAHYEQHLLLATLDPAGLSSETRLARGLGLRPRRGPGRATFGLLGLCGAAVAGLALLYTGGGPGRANRAGAPTSETAGAAIEPGGAVAPHGEVSPRGTPAGVAAARAPEVQIYRFPSPRVPIRRLGASAEKAGDVVHPGDELAFAYRNPAGMRRLLIFAVDEHGHVYWYHPEWSDAAENPTAVPISAEPGLHELPAAVLQKFDGERLMIHALFTDRELNVREVESAVAAAAVRDRAPGAPEPLTLPGTTDIVRPLRVVR